MKVRLCRTDEVDEGSMLQVRVPGQDPLAVYNINGAFYVTEDTCTHGKASLADEGELEGYTIICSWHDGRFDVRSGEALASPCTYPIRTFAVQLQQDAVWIEIDALDQAG